MPYQFLHFAGGSSAATAQPPAVPSSFEVMWWCWAMGRCITAPAGGSLLRESFTIRNSSAMKKLIVLSYFQRSICRISDPSFPGGPTAWFPPIRGLLQLGNDSLCCCSAVGWSSWTVWRGAKWHRRCWELQIGHGGLQWFAVPKQRGWASAECGRAAGLHMNHTLFTWFRFSSYISYDDCQHFSSCRGFSLCSNKNARQRTATYRKIRSLLGGSKKRLRLSEVNHK